MDRRKATKNGTSSKSDMLLGDARIRDESTANSRGARIETFGRRQIRESEERPVVDGVFASSEHFEKNIEYCSMLAF